jgi:hypothetical protein
MDDMRGILILLAALGVLAGEPAIAAPEPSQEVPTRLDFRAFLYQLEQQASAVASASVR